MINLFLSTSGRIGRAKWWFGQTLNIVIFFVGGVFFVVHSKLNIVHYYSLNDLILNNWMIFIPFAWINICLTAKRYHDRDKSEWWYLILLVPVVGALWVVLECGFLRGTQGANRYGDGGTSENLYNSPGSVDEQIAEIMRSNGKGELSNQAVPSFVPLPSTRNISPNQPISNSKAAGPVFGKRRS